MTNSAWLREQELLLKAALAGGILRPPICDEDRAALLNLITLGKVERVDPEAEEPVYRIKCRVPRSPVSK